MAASVIVNDTDTKVVSPLIFYGDTGEFIAKLEAVENPDPDAIKKISFSPSKDFKFVATKDKDCNIDIYLHINPKNLATSIPKIIGLTRKVQKELGYN